MTFVQHHGQRYVVWNGVRYLGTIERIAGKFMYIAPGIKQPLYPQELRELADKVEELNAYQELAATYRANV